MERTIEIVECTVIYDAWEEGADERERLSECVETVDVPFDEVVEYLREKCYVIEASVWPLECVSAHTWYSAEGYEHPYTGTLEERTFHPRGLTDDEAREIAIAALKR
jgi:hypothetical protein